MQGAFHRNERFYPVVTMQKLLHWRMLLVILSRFWKVLQLPYQSLFFNSLKWRILMSFVCHRLICLEMYFKVPSVLINKRNSSSSFIATSSGTVKLNNSPVRWTLKRPITRSVAFFHSCSCLSILLNKTRCCHKSKQYLYQLLNIKITRIPSPQSVSWCASFFEFIKSSPTQQPIHQPFVPY